VTKSPSPEYGARPASGVLRSACLLSLLVAAVSCGEGGRAGPRGEPEADSPPALGTPSAQEIAAGVFQGISGIDEPVTLHDGRWEGPPYVEGGASRPVVRLMDQPRVEHDFDGDGRDEVVVILMSTLGGTGTFMHLAVVESSPRGVVSRAVAFIGDRVQIEDARANGNEVTLDLIQHGEGDPSCCPQDSVTRVWRLEGSRLVEPGG